MGVSGPTGPKVSTNPVAEWLDGIYQERKVTQVASTRGGPGGSQLAGTSELPVPSRMDLPWMDGSLSGLADCVGVSRRRFGDYFEYDGGHVVAKAPTIGIHAVDAMLVAYGRETLSNLYPYDEQPDYDVGANHPACRECKIELRERTGGICGFCLERI